MRSTPKRWAIRPAAALGGREAWADGALARLSLPLSQVSPARAPAHGAVAQRHHLVGYAGMISDCAPMMLRVRPAH